jgi:hypothetical protein
MFPTTGADPGITITHTQPGVFVLASGFTYVVIGGDVGREAQAEITASDPQADSRWLRHPDRRIGERLPIGRPIVADRDWHADAQRSWHCQGSRPRSS